MRTESIEFQHDLHKIDSKEHIVQSREVPACHQKRKNVQGMGYEVSKLSFACQDVNLPFNEQKCSRRPLQVTFVACTMEQM